MMRLSLIRFILNCFIVLFFCNGVYAAQNTKTTYQYDTNGNLSHIVSPLNSTANRVVSDYQYDTLDRIKTIVQAAPAPGKPQSSIGIINDGQDQISEVDDPHHLSVS